MTRSTVRYPFEWMVFNFVDELSHRFTSGDNYRVFLMIFDNNGSVQTLLFDKPAKSWKEFIRIIDNSIDDKSYLFYDPFDRPVHQFISWHNIQQQTMERLIKTTFQQSDFDESKRFPTSWEVMY